MDSGRLGVLVLKLDSFRSHCRAGGPSAFTGRGALRIRRRPLGGRSVGGGVDWGSVARHGRWCHQVL